MLFAEKTQMHRFDCNSVACCLGKGSVCDPVVFAHFQCGLIFEPLEGWIVTSYMLIPRQTNRPKRALTSTCMEVTYKCRLLGLSLLLALAVFAQM